MAAPALPAGWTATNAIGPAPLWVTSPTTADTAPNDAVVKDPAEVSDKRLETRNIIVTSASAQLSFRNNFTLQDTFDGGVLEVSSPNIAGGAFTDITNQAVGGSFVSGGYTDTLTNGLGNPLAGRMAWSGNSGGYITTVVESRTERSGTYNQVALPSGHRSSRGSWGVADRYDLNRRSSLSLALLLLVTLLLVLDLALVLDARIVNQGTLRSRTTGPVTTG